MLLFPTHPPSAALLANVLKSRPAFCCEYIFNSYREFKRGYRPLFSIFPLPFGKEGGQGDGFY
jgi:hypothetical protein